ncbi:hypothetical protein GBAR_LOCUS30805 [Geodia barretti]|uniref:Uncharacterized protein n=1 Tax=Geodia barretti TaxID=519541 RepID=A0AA35U0P7_GEOBA|nr:hypothetical protein GBAR_LOCUS30805 [Geodia barretti]
MGGAMCRVAKYYLVTMAAQTTTTQEVCHCRLFATNYLHSATQDNEQMPVSFIMLRISFDGLYYNFNTERRHSLACCRIERSLRGGETTARSWGQRHS